MATASPSFELVEVSDGAAHTWSKGTFRGTYWWLVQDGITVAYAHTFFDSCEPEHRLRVVELEVREAYRGQGLARKLVSAIEEAMHERLWTDGFVTRMGLRRLHFLPVMAAWTWEPTLTVDSYVRDWDRRLRG